jgi:hypothetical protein
MEPFNIRDLAQSHAVDTVKALAVAQKMGMVNSEEDLTTLIASGIETALENLILKLEEIKNENNEA